ncbi:ABC transporter [Saccharothrix sp. ALI-22-I]|uniref:ABC transporter ATP-binding protein n=1 Tax=Saccharothrix sp. ALI-22-I TaxID=1933778 RepID=UPI00097C7258|nr:ABC transporter ATP-binding protein [Saccharothrix sp. ALI-22-I]ONI88790.1 ABC transporter [Saccharothrix sp. ALI-22-I]
MIDAIALDAVSKVYRTPVGTLTALDEVSVAFPRGSMTAVMGPSGSGKSTLLHCAAGLDRPTAGQVWLNDVDLGSLADRELDRVRRDRIGFVFQAFNLLPMLSVRDNVTLPLRMAGRKPHRHEVDAVLAAVGLGDLGRRRPAQLSGGQQQRVAVARSLITRPDVIFADEPTGSLDSQTAMQVMRLLREAVDEHGQTVVLVTHDPLVAEWADSTVYVLDGRIDRAPRQTEAKLRAVASGSRDHRGTR